jgi:hypothetical protein
MLALLIFPPPGFEALGHFHLPAQPRSLVHDAANSQGCKLSSRLLGFGQLDLLSQFDAELLTAGMLWAIGFFTLGLDQFQRIQT